MRDLTPERLHTALLYDGATGEFIWRFREFETFKGDAHTQRRCGRAWNTRYAGQRALTVDSGRGYLIGSVWDTLVYAHRVAWTMYHGEFPAEGLLVDHKNGARNDNRIQNLRLVTPLQSQFNRASAVGGYSAHKGVTFDKRRGKWQAHMQRGGKLRFLGYFAEEHDAALAYKAAAESYHGEYAHHNRPEG